MTDLQPIDTATKMTHLCCDCRHQFPICHARLIVFGIDKDPSLRGADADAVLECDAYEKRGALWHCAEESDCRKTIPESPK